MAEQRARELTALSKDELMEMILLREGLQQAPAVGLAVEAGERADSGRRTLRSRIAGFSASVAFLTLSHFAFFGLILPRLGPPKPPVDRERCKNSCWDTVFKGPYETPAKHGYHHFTFNATPQTLKIWAITVIANIFVYETFQYVFHLVMSGKVRRSMLLLLLAVVHSHYYSWWMFVGYWNDDYYPQWNHQLFFTWTELGSTALVLSMLDKTLQPPPRKLFGVAAIATLHIFAGGVDQFVANLFFQQGMKHQVARDLAFLSSDFVYLAVALFELRRLCRDSGITPLSVLLSLKREALIAFCGSSLVLIALRYL